MAKYRCSICGYIHEGELPEDFNVPNVGSLHRCLYY